MTKRGKLEIIRDILEIIQNSNNSIRVTPLLRKSGLSSQRFYEYFNELTEKQFVKELTNTHGDKIISLTDKGFNFIEKYRTIVSFIEEFDLD
jgi:predicted transcriptional regulator